MKKITLAVFIFTFTLCTANAQSDAYELNGEFGVTLGIAHYFGDLNTRANINRPKLALGAFYRKQFNNYFGIRGSLHYAQVGYSDVYSKNAYQKSRNLSFNSEIWELAVSGDFNFFKFLPADPRYRFTPFVSLGLGVFSYNPYAYLNDKKYYLRPLGTEGQNVNYVDANGNKRKPYGSMAICIPIGFGLKYNLSEKVNFTIQVAQRLTTTDYLDDVSTTYVGADKFPLVNGQPSVARILQDRSYEKGDPIGVEGRQRGWSKQKDQFGILEVGLSFNLSSYKCPASN